jgi:hypothetical protein
VEIKADVIEKLIEVWKKKRNQIIEGRLDGFMNYRTKDGGKVCTTRLKNSSGWYAIVCFYECSDIVEVYDMHVFNRYRERFVDRVGEDSVTTFIRRGNATGTILIKEDGEKTEKKVRDGAVLGNMKGNIVYHKTYITDEMITENKMDYLFELEDKT